MKQFLLISCLALLVGCTHSSKIASTTNPVVTSGPAGTWKVSYLYHAGSEETSLFDNYTFQFPASGGINATTAGVTTSGTYVRSSTGGEETIIIQFTGNPVSRLNNAWEVEKNTATEIELEKSGSSEKLHFTKQ